MTCEPDDGTTRPNIEDVTVQHHMSVDHTRVESAGSSHSRRRLLQLGAAAIPAVQLMGTPRSFALGTTGAAGDRGPQRPAPATVEPVATHDVRGGGGVSLHVREWGNLDAPAIVFIHGWSQSQLCWSHQIDSDLAERFRLVTFDLRGHGMSEKPADADAYRDAQLWADDVAAVIDQTGLDRPVLVGWSYGGFVITDYVRAHGQETIAGINLVGGAVMMNPTFDHIGPGVLDNAEDAVAPDLATNIAAVVRFLQVMTAQPRSWADWNTALAWNMVVSPEVRGALVSREIDADDVLSTLSVPVLVTHGRSDEHVLPSMAEHVLSVCATAEPSWYDGVAHMPFLEDPTRFNRELADLAARVN